MIKDHTGDARGVLRRWHDSLAVDGRFAGWLLEYHPGDDHRGAGAWIDLVHDEIIAQLCAWPSGYIDTCILRVAGDPDPVCGHAEVDSEDAIGAHAREFQERLLGLLHR